MLKKVYKAKALSCFELWMGPQAQSQTCVGFDPISKTYSTMSFMRFHLFNKASVSHLKSENSHSSYLSGFEGKGDPGGA